MFPRCFSIWKQEFFCVCVCVWGHSCSFWRSKICQPHSSVNPTLSTPLIGGVRIFLGTALSCITSVHDLSHVCIWRVCMSILYIFLVQTLWSVWGSLQQVSNHYLQQTCFPALCCQSLCLPAPSAWEFLPVCACSEWHCLERQKAGIQHEMESRLHQCWWYNAKCLCLWQLAWFSCHGYSAMIASSMITELTFKDVCHFADLCKGGPVTPGMHHIHHVRLEWVCIFILFHAQLGFCTDFGYPSSSVLQQRWIVATIRLRATREIRQISSRLYKEGHLGIPKVPLQQHSNLLSVHIWWLRTQSHFHSLLFSGLSPLQKWYFRVLPVLHIINVSICSCKPWSDHLLSKLLVLTK